MQLVDPYSAELASCAPAPLGEFNLAGIINSADVHVSVTLGDLSGVTDADVLLAVALAVRAPRLGHVFVDLATVSATATAEGDAIADEADLIWPEPGEWLRNVGRATALVGGDDGAGVVPLRLSGSRLYLDRYWREEQRLAESLRALSQTRSDIGELPLLARHLRELLPDPDDILQRAAVGAAVMRDLAVIAGGPGTGKTTTIAKLVQLLRTRAAERGQPEPLIALCAPTGKAAARMREAVGDGVDASTIHKLLGWLPGGRFRYNGGNRLPHDVVIVDETSMVPLMLMGRLAQAVRSGAQLVLIGDPDQLAAIEAGAVLRDIVGPAADQLSFGSGMRSLMQLAVGADLPASGGERSFGDGVVVLRRGHRFGEAIGGLADAVRRGDADAAVAALQSSGAEVIWLPDGGLELQQAAVTAYSSVIRAAEAGDAPAAIAALSSFRILSAHRRGPFGVSHWTREVETWLSDAIPGLRTENGTYVGRPLMVTENDYELQLFNGDTGVIVAAPATDGGGGTAASSAPPEPLAVFDSSRLGFAPSRLAAVETVYATTVHKSQGSQFDVAAVILPEPTSRLLTRELLYTAITRARGKLILVGPEAAIRAAVDRPLARATGLRELLWGER